MVEIKGGNSKEKISNEFYIDETVVPEKISPMISPVFSVNDMFSNVAKHVSGTSGTLYTTPTDEDFYLCTANISITGSSQSLNSAAHIIVVTENGESVNILKAIVRTDSTSIMSDSTAITLSYPLKLKRGSSITYSTTRTADRELSITGMTKPSYNKNG